MAEDYECLKQLSARALLEFEDVKAKYKEYFDKFSHEESKRKHLDSQFKQLKQVSLLAVEEYETLYKQYVTENKYREEIEKKLLKITKENKEIKQQNKLGAKTTIIPSNEVKEGSQGTKGELEVLRAMKDAVNNELRSTKNELAKVKEQLAQEQSAHKITNNHLNIGNQQIKQLNRVSVLALDEFNGFKKKYEVETGYRRIAEELAADMLQIQKLNERKSEILNEDTDKDIQIKKFMDEIDKLNAKSEKEKKQNIETIKELEDELASSQNVETVTSLEEKLSLSVEQLDIAQKQLLEVTARSKKSENDARNLYTRLALAERELDGRISSLPPPPPPPPPPPIAAPIIRKFIFKIGKKKKGNNTVDDVDSRHELAMADMIERIKKGVKLRSVPSSAKLELETEGAIGELSGLLSNLRRAQSPDSSIDLPQEDIRPEFARLKLKNCVQALPSVERDDGTSSELMKKLEKQKSVVDGVDIQEDTTQIEKPKKAPVDIPLLAEEKIQSENPITKSEETTDEAPQQSTIITNNTVVITEENTTSVETCSEKPDEINELVNNNALTNNYEDMDVSEKQVARNTYDVIANNTAAQTQCVYEELDPPTVVVSDATD